MEAVIAIMIIIFLLAVVGLTLSIEMRSRPSDGRNSANDDLSPLGSFHNPIERSVKRNTEQMATLFDNDIAVDLHLTFQEGIFGVTTCFSHSRLKRTSTETLMPQTETTKLTVPAGVGQGTRLRIVNKGDESVSGATGDLYIYLNMPYEYKGLQRKENDILSTLRLTAEQASQGGEFSILAVDGKEKVVMVPRGTLCREEIRLAGAGIPALGNPKKQGSHIVCVEF